LLAVWHLFPLPTWTHILTPADDGGEEKEEGKKDMKGMKGLSFLQLINRDRLWT